jgi:hypothetical protein
MKGPNRGCDPPCLVFATSILLFACFLAGALACQRFLYPFLFAGFQVEGVPLYFFNDVLRLHFPLEAAQGVFQ